MQIYCFLQYLVTRVTLRCNVLINICSYPPHLKHIVLKVFLEDFLPEMLSKVGVLAERSMKKSQKHHTIARRSYRAILTSISTSSIGSEQSTCPSSHHSTCLASQQGTCLASQKQDMPSVQSQHKGNHKGGRPKAAPLCGGGRRPPPLCWF